VQSVEGLKRTIAVTEELQSVVKTMKALAGVNIRQCERAAEAVAQYNHTIEMGLRIALDRVPARAISPDRIPKAPIGAIIFGSDQGMCGQLNDRVVEYASRALGKLRHRHEKQSLIAVGVRAAAQMENLGCQPDGIVEVPSSVAGINAAVDKVLHQIETWHFTGGYDMVALFYARPVSGAWYRIHGERLLPVDEEWIHTVKARPWPSRVIPMFNMDETQLLRALIREYLFVSLFRAFAESLASENASRLASMQVAERNIDDRLHALSGESQQLRQTAITSELLDIISAFEALRKQPAGARRG
jgi:F-type H+-transporting ATPase subunit gamma